MCVRVNVNVLVCMYMCVCLCVCVCVHEYSDLNDYSGDQWLSLKLRQCAC